VNLPHQVFWHLNSGVPNRQDGTRKHYQQWNSEFPSPTDMHESQASPYREDVRNVDACARVKCGDYLLSFDNESYREASKQEYIRRKQRAWFLKPMQEGLFESPSQMKLNEYIIVSRMDIL
jgi:hypothetical protein